MPTSPVSIPNLSKELLKARKGQSLMAFDRLKSRRFLCVGIITLVVLVALGATISIILANTENGPNSLEPTPEPTEPTIETTTECTESTTAPTPGPEKMSKVLVAAGNTSNSRASRATFEILDLENLTMECDDWQIALPSFQTRAVGGLYNRSELFICGGLSDLEFDHCYLCNQNNLHALDGDFHVWKFFDSAGVVIKRHNQEVLFITGGRGIL